MVARQLKLYKKTFKIYHFHREGKSWMFVSIPKHYGIRNHK